MKLTEFIRQNDIKCTDGEAFDNSPEFIKMKEFERTYNTISGVPFLEPETHDVKEIDVTLVGYDQDRTTQLDRPLRGRGSRFRDPGKR